MKFGEQLKTSLIKDYYYCYIAYDDLKEALYKGIAKGAEWDDEKEKNFLQLLEAELDKVFTFQKVKAAEIARRIKESEVEVEDVVRRLESANPPVEQDFLDLQDLLSDIIADVHDLAQYTRLNYTGFQKIIKKHDKHTKWPVKPIFSARLNARPFFKDNYDALVVKLSKLYDLVRTRGNPVKGDSSAGGGQQNFVRQTTKYWVHPDNITELKLVILKHLPVLVFNASKEFETEDSAITSIYYDNRDLNLYQGRLEKTEGAEAIRLRWYGGMKSDQIFVERKTHREDWTGEKSVKARFNLKEKHVNDFMNGEYTVPQAFEKMRKDGKKSLKEIESLEALAREVQYRVIKDKMRPVVRSFYNRTAFQLPGDARVRISLDTELTMVREDNFDGQNRTNGNWRRMDIGVDWPFNQLPEKDVLRFPYAVLEVKLQTQLGQEPPVWVRELVSSHLVEAVPKFSKFIHGCATLLPDMIDLIPFWLPQMDVDIRKPATTFQGIERAQVASGSSVSGSDDLDDLDELDDDGNYLDEEETAGESSHVRFNGNGSASAAASTSPNASTSATENTPLLGSGSGSASGDVGPAKQLLNALESAGNWLKDTFVAGKDDYSKVPAGTVFDTRVIVPEGKRISVPVRVEPKVYFANERTFLSWIEIGILLGAIAGTLLNYGDKLAIQAAFGFFIAAVITILYSIGMYLWRVYNIRRKRAIRYDDQVGPTAICLVLAFAIGANFVARLTHSGGPV